MIPGFPNYKLEAGSSALDSQMAFRPGGRDLRKLMMNHKRLYTMISFGLVLVTCASSRSPQLASSQPLVQVSGAKLRVLAGSKKIARAASKTWVTGKLVLPLRNEKDLDELLKDLYDPASPNCGQYLTPQQFQDRFGASQEDYDAVVNFVHSKGLQVAPNKTRAFIDVSGTAGDMERAFNVQIDTFKLPATGAKPAQTYFASDREAALPADLAHKVLAVVGLTNYRQAPKPQDYDVWGLGELLNSSGNGHTGVFGNSKDYSPSDLRGAYGLGGVPATGKGQTLGVYSSGGYYLADGAAYGSFYGIQVPVVARSVNGQLTSVDSDAAGEAALDVEMEMAFSPNANKVMIYSDNGAADSTASEIDTFYAVLEDNAVSVFSCSFDFGVPQDNEGLVIWPSVFRQFAAQGITIVASSGDSGANLFGNGFIMASPYITTVGGTALYMNPDGSNRVEQVWNERLFGSVYLGSGGGYDNGYAIPSYQQTGILGPFNVTTNGGSSMYRNTPDVSAEACFDPGVDCYTNGSWGPEAGTSVSSPIWGGFLGTVNQVRAQAGLPRLGFANPALYSIAQLNTSPTFPFAGAFHDITVGNNWDFVSGDPSFSAGLGYDNCSGNGSFDGERMIGALCMIPGPTYNPPPAATNFKATTASGSVKLSWTAPKGAKGYLVYRTPAPNGNPNSIGFLTSQTTTSYTDSTVKPGTTYTYSLMAVNTGGGIFAAPLVVTTSK